MQSVTVFLRQNHTNVTVVEITKGDEEGKESDGRWVKDALREFAAAANGFEEGEDRYQVWIAAYLSQATFMWPIEFSRLVSEKGWTVVFDLND